MTLHGSDTSTTHERSRPGDTPARQYARMWQSQSPRLEEFLASRGEMTPGELAAVVRIDLRERYRTGQRPDARRYLDQFPALAVEPELAVDIVYAEYLAREQLGEQPTLAEYELRFPEFAQVLADQVSLHEAFAGQPTDVGQEPPEIEGGAAERRADRAAGRLEADYEILEELGRGGMGVVYRARQPALNRLVALKMVRQADLGNDELLARFRSEAEVVASLHHPHIVQVYDYGEYDGAPYLALELVEGGSLASRLDGTPWNPQRAAALLEQLARAVHFAHERGVVHRDLKPNNLLVSSTGEPLELKIADFGLAKVFRDQQVAQTQTGALLGTPSYMSPEQAHGRIGTVGPATDVYALGAILYELLSGRPPHRGETAIATLQQLLLAEPASIHRLAPGVPRDLATICTKCLERDPARRYASALELAEDLSRFRSDRPIHARRTGGFERGWRWCRRNPALAAAMGAIATLLIAVTAVSTWYSGRLSRQLEITQRAERAERQANDDAQIRLWDAYLAEVSARTSSRQLGQRFAALQTIERAQKLLPTVGFTEQRQLQLRSAAITALALPDLRQVQKLPTAHLPVFNGATALAVDQFALNLAGNRLLLGRVSDGAVIAEVEHAINIAYPTLAPDGQYVGLSGESGLRVWRIVDGKLLDAWAAPDGAWLSFAPDGRHAVVSRRGAGLTLVDRASGEIIRRLSDVEAASPTVFHAHSHRLAFCTGRDIRVIAWDTGELIATIPSVRLSGPLAWHPSGEYLAAWGDHEISLWNLRTRKKFLTLSHPGFPQQLHFSADGMRLVSCSLWDEKLILWDVGTAQKELEVLGFANLAIDIDHSGRLGLMRRDGNGVELWELAAGSECRSLTRSWFPSQGGKSCAAISPDSRLLALSGERGLELWDLEHCQRVATRNESPCMAQFDRQGNLIVAQSTDIYRWPRHERLRPAAGRDPARPVVSFGPPEHLSRIAAVSSLATGNPNQVLFFEDMDAWYTASLEKRGSRIPVRPPGDPRKAALSHDDRFAAVASWDNAGATVWEAGSGKLVADLPIGRHGMLEFSPDGRWLATTPGGVQLWRTSDWQLAHEFHARGTTPNGLGISFSSDSRALAIAQPNGELRLVDPLLGHDWAQVTHPARGAAALVAFSPDNRRLATIPSDGISPARIWNLAAVRRSLSELGLDWPADVLTCGPEPPQNLLPIEIEWNDGGWQLLKGAARALRGGVTKAQRSE